MYLTWCILSLKIISLVPKLQTVEALLAGNGWRHPLAEHAQVKQAGVRFVQLVPYLYAFTVSFLAFLPFEDGLGGQA